MSLTTVGIAVLEPRGVVAAQERDLMYIAVLLGLVVLIPVFIMTFAIVWRYRESKGARYTPDWDHSTVMESIWWGLPCAIILVLSVITWNSSHRLDPFRALDSNTRPLTIQVVALQWKWLFIYPEQNIASVNFVQLPEHTPVRFEVTADGPMNSLWIPQLGGQIYAMAGMSTQLHLMADGLGSYRGSSANLSGAGFAGMHFMARSTSQQDFSAWVDQAKHQPVVLDAPAYAKLSRPSQNDMPATYAYSDPFLYDAIIHKYLGPVGGSPAGQLAGIE